jgi:hypothetical protein
MERDFRLGVYESELPWIAKHSLINCHVRGVDSVMFDDTPNKRIRVFIAHPEHELWLNKTPFQAELSAALHPHHCNVTLSIHSGEVYNILGLPYDFVGDAGYNCFVKLQEFTFKSQITTNQGSFVSTGKSQCFSCYGRLMTEPVHMKASDIHTMYSPKGTSSSWFVDEHEEDPGYKNVAYSNWNLEKFSFDDFYKPMSEDHLRNLLNELRIPVLS